MTKDQFIVSKDQIKKVRIFYDKAKINEDIIKYQNKRIESLINLKELQSKELIKKDKEIKHINLLCKVKIVGISIVFVVLLI